MINKFNKNDIIIRDDIKFKIATTPTDYMIGHDPYYTYEDNKGITRWISKDKMEELFTLSLDLFI